MTHKQQQKQQLKTDHESEDETCLHYYSGAMLKTRVEKSGCSASVRAEVAAVVGGILVLAYAI